MNQIEFEMSVAVQFFFFGCSSLFYSLAVSVAVVFHSSLASQDSLV